MSGNNNRYLNQMAAVIQSPIAFTSSTGSANVAAAVATTRANIDLIIAKISRESMSHDERRDHLDEMSNPARVDLYKILTDLKAAVAA